DFHVTGVQTCALPILNGYLSARKSEPLEEMPLLLVENQQYIHYQKASVVFYALKEYIGEAALNQALRDYIKQVGFQEPPYTISRSEERRVGKECNSGW